MTWLLGLLAVASVAVLVGGRMAELTRRVGLLKAVGGTSGLVAAILLAEHLMLALVAAGIGLLVGWLCAPLLTNPGPRLVGVPGAPPVTLDTIGLVVAVALGVAVAATFVPPFAPPGQAPSGPWPTRPARHGVGPGWS